MLLDTYLSQYLSLVLFLCASVAHARQEACSNFSLQDVPDVVVRNTTYYAAGDTVNLTTNMSSIDTNELSSFCRVQLSIITNTTANSSCNTEVWLPDDWNGRFLTVGNGGYAGGGKRKQWINACRTTIITIFSVDVGDLGYVAVLQGCKYYGLPIVLFLEVIFHV